MVATVSHTFQSADDEPERGLITFRPLTAAVNESSAVRTVTAALDPAGSVTVDLVASDDLGWRLSVETMGGTIAKNQPILIRFTY